jgi:hypothetical protein
MQLSSEEQKYVVATCEISTNLSRRATSQLILSYFRQPDFTPFASPKIDPKETPGIPLDIDEKSAKRGKVGVRRALQLVQHSTASMGR